jgi:septum formation protein
MIKNKIILASASPRRKDILRQFGYDPEVIVADYDEHKIDEKDPYELVRKLSYGKAYAVREHAQDEDIIIGADTIVVVDGKIYGKPQDEQDAFRMIRSIAGRVHEVCTGVTVILCGKPVDKCETFCDATEVHVATMTDEQIYEYIATGEPMDKAGAYAIQGKFGRYVEKINGDVYTVIGLSGARTFETMEGMIDCG